jgi:hypothetical protein
VLKLLVDWLATEGVRVQPMTTVFACTDDSNSAYSTFVVVPAWCAEDETTTEGLLPINR